MIEECALAEGLIRFDTSRPEELRSAAGFIRGWLEARDIDVRVDDHAGLPLLVAEVGPAQPALGGGPTATSGGPAQPALGGGPTATSGGPAQPALGGGPTATSGDSHIPTVVFHGHLDVVPGHDEQFSPLADGDRLIGRGAYDMKGGLAAMLCALKDLEKQDRVRVRFVCVPDEESEDLDERATDAFVAGGLGGHFAITGEPTDLHVGVEAKGVLVMRIVVNGRSAHSSTPWLGDNAVLKAIDVFRCIETLPFSRESTEIFDRPSINVGRIEGGDALNKVPDRCTMWVDVRYLPGQDPEEIIEQVRAIRDIEVERTFIHPPVSVSPENPFVLALREAVSRSTRGESLSVGRDGASEAAAFIKAGIPAVEFGPVGAGHHGPEEWVSISSLARYRKALTDFVRLLPIALDESGTLAGGSVTSGPQTGPVEKPPTGRGYSTRSPASGRPSRRPS